MATRGTYPIFDFQATATGAEWIDGIAAHAKPLATGSGESLVGHCDWSGKHFRFSGKRITAVYDWDSVRLAREAVIVGSAAMTVATNFDMPCLKRAPTPDEVRAFVDEYSAARNAPLSRRQREEVAACATSSPHTPRVASTAATGLRRRSRYPNSFTAALREHGLNYLVP